MAPLIRPPSRRGTSRAPAIVRLQALEGLWEVAAADRRRGVWPEELGCEWDDWGAKTARFVLRRDAGQSYPDLTGLTPVEIEQGAGIWEGFIDSTPVLDEHSLEVACIGWPDYAGDDLLAKTYVHSEQAAWRDGRSFLDQQLASWPANLRAELDNGVMRFGCPNGTTWVNAGAVGFILDMGPGNVCGRLVLELQRIQSAGAGTELYARACDTPGAAHLGVAGHYTAGSFDGTQLSAISQTSSIYRTTYATPRRYVAIFLYRAGATYTATLDDIVRVRRVLAFPAASWETGDDSNVKASSVLADLVPRLCPQWSQDLTGIDPTTLKFPHLAATAPRSFREWADAVNAPHGYIRKLERGRQFRFKARPTKPIIAAGDWPGIVYRDASKNATRDLYNRALGVGTNGAGEAIMVDRRAGNQPGVNFDSPPSPAFPNPGADVNATGWFSDGGAITRDTAQFHTGPASIKIVPAGDDTLYTNLTGTLAAGVPYTISGWVRQPGALDEIGLALIGDGSFLIESFVPATLDLVSGVWTAWVLSFTPGATVTNPQLQYELTGAPATWVDDHTILSARPTLLDKRGRVRAKTVDMPSQSVDQLVMEAFADTWLQSHMRTRASGSIEATGNVLRDYVSGEPIRPFETGERTSELVCLLNEIDPDTGGIGRDIPITAVAADPGQENARLTLDTPYDDFQALVSRYDLVAGRG